MLFLLHIQMVGCSSNILYGQLFSFHCSTSDASTFNVQFWMLIHVYILHFAMYAEVLNAPRSIVNVFEHLNLVSLWYQHKRWRLFVESSPKSFELCRNTNLCGSFLLLFFLLSIGFSYNNFKIQNKNKANKHQREEEEERHKYNKQRTIQIPEFLGSKINDIMVDG